MKCEEFQEYILMGETPKGELKKHLDACQACKSFSQELEVMMTNQADVKVPKNLDDKILTFAKENRPSRKADKPVVPFIIFSLAAMLAIAFSINYLKSDSSTGIAGAEVVKRPNNNHIVEVPVVVSEVQLQKQNDILENLWDDESLDADLLAVESEIFMMSAEIYVE